MKRSKFSEDQIVYAPLIPVPAVGGLSLRFRMELITPHSNIFINTALLAIPTGLHSSATNQWRPAFLDTN